MVPHSAFLTGLYCVAEMLGVGGRSAHKGKQDNLGKESKFAWLKCVVYALS